MRIKVVKRPLRPVAAAECIQLQIRMKEVCALPVQRMQSKQILGVRIIEENKKLDVIVRILIYKIIIAHFVFR